MKLHMPRVPFAVFLLTFLLCGDLKAQETIGIRVSALTSAERDSLNKRLPATGPLKLIYACVPAGILVFRAAQAGTLREALRSQAVNALAPVIAGNRLGPADLDLQAAEAACQTARDQ